MSGLQFIILIPSRAIFRSLSNRIRYFRIFERELNKQKQNDVQIKCKPCTATFLLLLFRHEKREREAEKKLRVESCQLSIFIFSVCVSLSLARAREFGLSYSSSFSCREHHQEFILIIIVSLLQFSSVHLSTRLKFLDKLRELNFDVRNDEEEENNNNDDDDSDVDLRKKRRTCMSFSSQMRFVVFVNARGNIQ